MDKSDNMGWGDSACGNGNHKMQVKSNFVHNWMHKITSWIPKKESFYLTPSLLLDFECNIKHELKGKKSGTCQAIWENVYKISTKNNRRS
jgi:hypothetical protein